MPVLLCYNCIIKREENNPMKKIFVVMCHVPEGTFSLSCMPSEIDAVECVAYMTAIDPSASYWYEVREGA